MDTKAKGKSFDDALDALAASYRRQLLVALLEHNPQDDEDRDPLDVIPEPDEPEVLQTELVHVHLPKLEELGYITWNREENTISKGPNWEEIAPLLGLIERNRDELPDGWL
jgi:hypothetical protein